MLQENKQTNRQTDRQTDKQTNIQTEANILPTVTDSVCIGNDKIRQFAWTESPHSYALHTLGLQSINQKLACACAEK